MVGLFEAYDSNLDLTHERPPGHGTVTHLARARRPDSVTRPRRRRSTRAPLPPPRAIRGRGHMPTRRREPPKPLRQGRPAARRAGFCTCRATRMQKRSFRFARRTLLRPAPTADLVCAARATFRRAAFAISWLAPRPRRSRVPHKGGRPHAEAECSRHARAALCAASCRDFAASTQDWLYRAVSPLYGFRCASKNARMRRRASRADSSW
jgi:hypothetical protein